MANTTTTTVAGLIQAIIAESNARFQINSDGIIETLVRVDGNTTAVDFPIYTPLAASSVTEGTEGTDFSTVTTITNTAVTLTVVEYLEMAVLTDKAVRASSAHDNLVSTSALKLGNNQAAALEKHVVSLFSGFNTTTVSGMDGTDQISLTAWFNAIEALVSAGSDRDDLVAVISPKQFWGPKSIRSSLTDGVFAGEDSLSEEFQQNGFVGKIAGVPVFISKQIVQSGSTASGAMYDAKQCLGLAVMGPLLDIKTERNESLRGEEMISISLHKAGVLIESLGVELLSDIS